LAGLNFISRSLYETKFFLRLYIERKTASKYSELIIQGTIIFIRIYPAETDSTITLEWAEYLPTLNPQCLPESALVLLHEGLGCVAMWRQFPQLLADHTGHRVIAYSRQSYGASSNLTYSRDVDFFKIEATEVLPAFLKALGVTNPILIGHSDGATIALLGAAYLPNIRATVVMAPHLFVEDISIQSISATKTAFSDNASGLREKLSQFHTDVDGAFYGWADIWLRTEFRNWTITEEIALIKTPLLAIQGHQDQYGTMRQIDELQRLALQAQLLKIENCRHSPHFDQPEQVLQAIKAFVTALEVSIVAK
jgi:pimeloyl-ACP methyl ester carboxylesterase